MLQFAGNAGLAAPDLVGLCSAMETRFGQLLLDKERQLSEIKSQLGERDQQLSRVKVCIII